MLTTRSPLHVPGHPMGRRLVAVVLLGRHGQEGPHVDPGILECSAGPDGQLARPAQRGAGPGAPEQVGRREGRGIRTCLEIFDSQDLGYLGRASPTGTVDDEIYRLRHQRVQRRDGQVGTGVGQLADEAEPRQGLTGGAGMDRGVPLHARAEGEKQRESLPAPGTSVSAPTPRASGTRSTCPRPRWAGTSAG